MSPPVSTIAVGIDGSPIAAAALDFAMARAKALNAGLTILYAIDPVMIATRTASPYTVCDPTDIIDSVQHDGEALLESAKSYAAEVGVTARTEMVDGAPADAILEWAAEDAPGALVVGTHGRAGLSELFLGSVAYGIVRSAHVPVFVIPANARPQATISRALVAVDGSRNSDRAVATAMALAAAEHFALTFCIVGREDALAHVELLASDASARGISARAVAREGNPVEEILEEAGEENAQLIFMGTHGRAGLEKLLVGSVTQGVIRGARVPVCVVRG